MTYLLLGLFGGLLATTAAGRALTAVAVIVVTPVVICVAATCAFKFAGDTLLGLVLQ